jgi:hypothetical protein
MAQVNAVCHDKWHKGLSGPAGVSNVDLTTLSRDAAHAHCLQVMPILQRSKETGILPLLESNMDIISETAVTVRSSGLYCVLLSANSSLDRRVLTAFWDITPCSPLKINRRFGGTYRLHYSGRIISRPNRALLSTCFHADILFGLFYSEDGDDMFLWNIGLHYFYVKTRDIN